MGKTVQARGHLVSSGAEVELPGWADGACWELQESLQRGNGKLWIAHCQAG